LTEPAAAAASTSTPARDGQLLERTVFEVKRVIVGQDRLVERMLVGLLSRGHLLLEGVPGVAKTLAVETFAKVVGFLAVLLGAGNAAGGYVVTERMLEMFKSSKKPEAKA